MQELETGHRITIWIGGVHPQSAVGVNEIVRLGDALNIENTAVVCLANETNAIGNFDHSPIFEGHAAQEG